MNSIDFGFPNDLPPGTYKLCRYDGSNPRELAERDITVVAAPTVSITGSTVSTRTLVGLTGVSFGDIFVFKDTSCDGAHNTTTSANSLKASVDQQGNIYTDTAMSNAVLMRVCYATVESLGDTSTDFINIGPFRQNTIDYDLKRVVAGSGPYSVAFTGLSTYDTVVLKEDNCTGIEDHVTTATGTRSVASMQSEIVIGTTMTLTPLLAGAYKLCLGYNYTNYIELEGRELTVISQPTFSPNDNSASAQASIDIAGATAGDWVVMQEGGCASAAIPSGANLEVKAEAGQAKVLIQSEGIESTAEMVVAAQSSQSAVLTLQEGDNKFEMLHRGSDKNLVLTNGVNDLLTVSHTTGATFLKGDITVGGTGTTGDKRLTIHSFDNTASFNLESGGANSDTSLEMVSLSGRDAYVSLKEGTNEIQISHRASSDSLVIKDSNHDLLSVARTTGDVGVRGNLMVGGVGTSGARAATVLSTTGDATLKVESGGVGIATVSIEAHNDADALLSLTSGTASFSVLNAGATGEFVVRDSVGDLLSIKRITGETTTRGDLTVGGAAATGPVLAQVISPNGTAEVLVESGGASTEASVVVRSQPGMNASLSLVETDGKSFNVLNRGSESKMVIEEGGFDLMSIEAGTGNMAMRGDLLIGGSVAGSVASSIRSTPGSAWLPKSKLGSGSSLSTLTTMRQGAFKVCYATKESDGNGAGDFVELSTSFDQSDTWFAGVRTSLRLVQGASGGPHNISLYGGIAVGDEIFFQKDSCMGSLTLGIGRTNTSTAAEVGFVSISASTSLGAGDYKACHRNATEAALYAELPGLTLTIVPAPSFNPASGQAGQATTVTILGAVVGDFIVMQASDCTGAAAAVTSTSSLARTALSSNLEVDTLPSMTSAQSLKVCYATAESGGVSDSDYKALGDFEQSTIEWSL